MSKAEIKRLAEQLRGIVNILNHAGPEDRNAAYRELNLSVVCHDSGRLEVSAGPDLCNNKGVGGGLELLMGSSDEWWLFQESACLQPFRALVRSDRSRRFRAFTGVLMTS